MTQQEQTPIEGDGTEKQEQEATNAKKNQITDNDTTKTTVDSEDNQKTTTNITEEVTSEVETETEDKAESVIGNEVEKSDTGSTETDEHDVHNEDMEKLKVLEDDVNEDALQTVLQEDYVDADKATLIKVGLESSKKFNIAESFRILRHLEPFYTKLSNADKAEALEKYIADGGEKESFDYRNAEDDNFYTLYKAIKADFKKEQQQLKEDKVKNVAAGNHIIEAIREILQSPENENSIQKIRELQEEWRNLGPMSPGESHELFKTYRALLDLYYDNRSIFYDLKDLDRKKNLEKKIAICEKAEALVNYKPFPKVFGILRQLHEDYKHVGPVPREENENVWQRFKKASDVLYAMRKDLDKAFEAERKENLAKKTVLFEKIEPYEHFEGKKFSEWTAKTKEVQAIQKEWEAIGPIPKNASNEISKGFWAKLKKFFNNKNRFYKDSQKLRNENLEKKKVLVEKAIALKDSTEWRETAEVLKQLQKDWKEIGPVPEEVSNKIYRKFNDACNAFFEHKKQHRKDVSHEFKDNLKAKREIIDQINEMAKTEQPSMDLFNEKVTAFNEIGFVPKNNISKIQEQYDKAVNNFMGSLDISLEEKAKFSLEIELVKIKAAANPERLIVNKEQELRKKIRTMEDEIALWNNNLAFFKSSKKVQPMKEEFEGKIKLNKDRIEMFKQQLRILNKIKL